MSALHLAATRNYVLITAAVLLLAAAAIYALLPEDEQRLLPTDESSWVFFKCADCGAEFHLDGREMDAAVRSGALGSGRHIETYAVTCKECGSRNTEELHDGSIPDTVPGP